MLSIRKTQLVIRRILALSIVLPLFLYPLVGSAQMSRVIGSKTFVQDDKGKQWLKVGEELLEVVPDVVTVKFRTDAKLASPEAAIQEYGIKIKRQNKLGFYDIEVPSGKTAVDFVEELSQDPRIESAEVNTYGKYLQRIPNDTRFNEQWNLNNTGQTGGTVDADINAPEAWDLETGRPEVIIAVVDSGVDIDHDDLACNVWLNSKEIAGNGLDDDGNGFIDDTNGWDFFNGNNDPRGTFFHGTHVAGIVGACGNNTAGIIGVAGGFASNNGVTLMPLGVGDSAPDGSVLDDAIIYATDMGAKVITLSLEVGQASAIDAALTYAHGQGVFIDNASGNGNGPVSYPATNPNVMAVGATDHNDVRPDFSNRGPELEVVAPGVDILSTQLNNTYGTDSGTSYASPHVAGLAGLMFSLNPAATNDQVRACIRTTAKDLGAPGRDDLYGQGRIDAAAALSCIQAVQVSCQGKAPCDGGVCTVSVPGSSITYADSVPGITSDAFGFRVKTPGGLLSWNVKGVNRSFAQQSFYRLGNDNHETSFVSNFDFDPLLCKDDSKAEIYAIYDGGATPIKVNVTYSLLGKIPGRESLVLKKVVVMNKTGAPIDLKWFDYSDFDVNSVPTSDDLIQSFVHGGPGGTRVINQAGGGLSVLSQWPLTVQDSGTIHGQPATFRIAPWVANPNVNNLLADLLDTSITNLTSVYDQALTKNDFVHAVQFNFTGVTDRVGMLMSSTLGLTGDIDGDGDVDFDDLNIVLAARTGPVKLPNSDIHLLDLDGDGKITALDARKLALLCTRPRCATQ